VLWLAAVPLAGWWRWWWWWRWRRWWCLSALVVFGRKMYFFTHLLQLN